MWHNKSSGEAYFLFERKDRKRVTSGQSPFIGSPRKFKKAHRTQGDE